MPIGDDTGRRHSPGPFLSLPDHLLRADPTVSADARDMLEAYTTLGFLAASTERVRLGTAVAAVTFREPALLVKAVDTVDALSSGRAWLGIGAAARLHLAQQPLSAAIRRFEADLGVELFRRTTRHVELTDARRALLEPARTALRAADDALAAACGVGGDLRFGLSSGARYGLEPLFSALAQRYPAVRLHTRHDSAAPLLDDVRSGRLDVAVTFGGAGSRRSRRNPPQGRARRRGRRRHPRLAGRGTVALAELRGETFALDIPDANPDYDRTVVKACRRSGFAPRTRVSSAFHDSWEGAVHGEGCVGLTVRTAVHAAHRDLQLLRLEGT